MFRFRTVKVTIIDWRDWPGTPILPLGNPNSSLPIMDMRPRDDFREVAIKNPGDEVFSPEQIGWRFALGTVLIIGGYGAWSLIPVVIEADLEPSMKAALSGLFGATPFLTKVVAIALMGRPAYNFLKRTIFQYVRKAAGRVQD
jgi:hypothetical protein